MLHTPLERMLQIDSLPHQLRMAFEFAAALTTLLFAFALRRRRWILSSGTFVMLALGLLADILARLARTAPALEEALGALGIALFLWGVIRMAMEIYEWVMRRRREHFSTIFKSLLTAGLYFLVVMVVLRVDLQFNITSLIAWSAAATAVIGFALQWTLGDIFSGLALQIQRPFNPGDWVKAGEHLGRFTGIGLRSTTVMTRANERLEIPNALVAKDVLVNYQTGYVADEIAVGISYGVPPNRVREVVLHVLHDVPHVLSTPAPEIYAWEYGDYAIRYRVKYWIRDYGVQEVVRDTVVSSLWYALRRHAIEIPFPIRTLQMRQPVADEAKEEADFEREIIAELRQVEILRGLTDDELRVLAATVQVREFGRGEILVRQGEQGETAYVIRRGRAEVLVRGDDGSSHKVNELTRSAFIGEPALLLGDPRNATIRALTDVEVLEMDREGFTELFKDHPQTVNMIIDVIAARAEQRREVLAHASEGDGTRGRRNRLVVKIKEIFDIR